MWNAFTHSLDTAQGIVGLMPPSRANVAVSTKLLTSSLLGHGCGGRSQLSGKAIISCCKLVLEFITPPSPETKRDCSLFGLRFSVGSSVLGLGRVADWFPQVQNQPRDLLKVLVQATLLRRKNLSKAYQPSSCIFLVDPASCSDSESGNILARSFCSPKLSDATENNNNNNRQC